MRKLKLAKSERIQGQACLRCGAVNDAATGIVDKQARNKLLPKPGDITLCLYCAHVMRFADDMSFRSLTADEQRMLANDPRFQATKDVLTKYQKERTKH